MFFAKESQIQIHTKMQMSVIKTGMGRMSSRCSLILDSLYELGQIQLLSEPVVLNYFKWKAEVIFDICCCFASKNRFWQWWGSPPAKKNETRTSGEGRGGIKKVRRQNLSISNFCHGLSPTQNTTPVQGWLLGSTGRRKNTASSTHSDHWVQATQSVYENIEEHFFHLFRTSQLLSWLHIHELSRSCQKSWG